MPNASNYLNTSIALLYSFTFADSVLKFGPHWIALPLRYLPEAVLYVLAARAFLERRRYEPRPFPLLPPTLAFLIVAILSTIANGSLAIVALSDFRTLFRFVPFAYVLSTRRLTQKQVRSFAAHLIAIALIQIAAGIAQLSFGRAARAILQPATGWLVDDADRFTRSVSTGFGWLSGTLSNYNHYGIFMALSCTLALALLTHRLSRLSAWFVPLAAITVLLSFSRHAIGALFVGALILIASRRQLILCSLLASAAALLLILGSPSLPDATILLPGSDITFSQRLASALSEPVLAGDRSANVRYYLMKEVPGRVLASAPLLGFGPGSVSAALELRSFGLDVAPNPDVMPDLAPQHLWYVGDVVWVMILASYGCAGLAAFGYLLVTVLRLAVTRARTAPSPEIRALGDTCIAWTAIMIIAGFFGLTIIARDTIPVFWMAVGIMLSPTIQRPSSSTETRVA